MKKENEEEIDEGVLGMEVKKERDFTLFGKKFKVVENGSEDKVEVNGEGLDSPGHLDSLGFFFPIATDSRFFFPISPSLLLVGPTHIPTSNLSSIVGHVWSSIWLVCL